MEFVVYLFAVQIEVLVADLQLQNLHLVVPFFYYRGVPHRPPEQCWFKPSHDLGKEQKQQQQTSLTSGSAVRNQRGHTLAGVYPCVAWHSTAHVHRHTYTHCTLPSHPSASFNGSRGGGTVSGDTCITVTDLLSAWGYLSLINHSLTRLGLRWGNTLGGEEAAGDHVSKTHQAAVPHPSSNGVLCQNPA